MSGEQREGGVPQGAAGGRSLNKSDGDGAKGKQFRKEGSRFVKRKSRFEQIMD